MATDRCVGQVMGGRYKIEELLGQGGMSSVYRAYDPNLQRKVAIKLIHPHLSNNDEFVHRFESEATAIARLRHPNIVQVFDFNHDGDLYYMVLEFVAGETLQSRIKRLNASGRYVPIRDVLHYTIDICKAADYAHQRGLIHRDIKPANVMLDVNGNAILMDFGIARILGSQQHTATGAVLGTALYMSPEQIQGLHPDVRADIYSIGVMLFEALGGHPPFEADSAMTLMMMHLNDPVPDISKLHPGIPESVKAIINRSLEKDRSRRFQSCLELVDGLQKALDGLRMEEPALIEKTRVEDVLGTLPQKTIIEAPPPPPAMATIIEPPVAQKHAVTAIPTHTQPAPSVNRDAKSWLQETADNRATGLPPKEPEFIAAPRRRGVLLSGIAFLLLAAAGGGYLFFQGNSPRVAPSPTPVAALITLAGTSTVAAPTNTQTAEPMVAPTSTDTLVPSATPTESVIPTNTPQALAVPKIGGADKIAYLFESNIWIANIDGSKVEQITEDGTIKKYLRWLPDGQGLSYISGKCIQTVGLDGTVGTFTCFNYSDYLDSFEVSPDGKQVALSLDRQLYLIPFDLEKLGRANSHSDLTAMAACDKLAPYQRNSAIAARWSKDSQTLAVIALGVLADGRRGEIVQIVAVDRCIPNPVVQVQFPQPHFTFGEYNHNPTLPGLSWDGDSLFALSGLTRNDGFGDLHFFNRETYKAELSVNPINKVCCYSGPQFSPDGQYLLLAFQDISLGASSVTQIYYIPYGTIGSGVVYQPLPLPEFTNPKELPQAILRPAASP